MSFLDIGTGGLDIGIGNCYKNRVMKQEGEMTRHREISNYDDTIDIRDVIERVEELEGDLDDNDRPDDEDAEEYGRLTALLDDLKGYGGDEQWRGDWYPITLIRDSYFVDAMQELVEDIGDMPKGFPAYLEIDWKATARNLQVDYSSVDFGDVTYWYR